MSDMPDNIWAIHVHIDDATWYECPVPDTEKYIRADIHEAKIKELEFLLRGARDLNSSLFRRLVKEPPRHYSSRKHPKSNPMSDTPELMDEDMLMHRIKAHLASPDVYDPPTFDEMADRIKELEAQVESTTRAIDHYDDSFWELYRDKQRRIKELEVRIDELEVVVKKLWRRQDSLDTFDAAVNDILSPLFEEQPHE
jgi:DNA repair ATPase RecN